MKFGRLLRDASAELPEMESLFSCYKQLKKQLKRINATNHPSGCDSISSDDAGEPEGSAGSVASKVAQADARNAMPPPPPPSAVAAPARVRDTAGEPTYLVLKPSFHILCAAGIYPAVSSTFPLVQCPKSRVSSFTAAY
eukprot:CAMPEP_0177765608 /NCGR_PEP_ID=MMETSP0491_2-20121128/8082_1 /TAXON_ID=63592 /ORGANISM="Tetraselmis chuii, Strain PLY429" /LENGTH=138 /DNA_ID=CAMNT_0019281967 /DNA_START=615 /DNA_END=1031 /DNA_ORIENTATION=+